MARPSPPEPARDAITEPREARCHHPQRRCSDDAARVDDRERGVLVPADEYLARDEQLGVAPQVGRRHERRVARPLRIVGVGENVVDIEQGERPQSQSFRLEDRRFWQAAAPGAALRLGQLFIAAGKGGW